MNEVKTNPYLLLDFKRFPDFLNVTMAPLAKRWSNILQLKRKNYQEKIYTKYKFDNSEVSSCDSKNDIYFSVIKF